MVYYDNVYKPPTSGLGFHGISVNSSIMDEGAPVQKDSPTISNLNCVLSIGQHIHAKEILGGFGSYK